MRLLRVFRQRRESVSEGSGGDVLSPTVPEDTQNAFARHDTDVMAMRFYGADKNRFRLLIAAFFLALALPTIALVRQAFAQLELDAFRRQQVLAQEFTQRIDETMAAAVGAEDARSVGDYRFLVVSGDPQASFLQQSALSAFPVRSAIPGVIGYFEIDPAGEFSTPLLPDADVDAAVYGIGAEQQAERAAVAAEIRGILNASSIARAVADSADLRERAGAAFAGGSRAGSASAATGARTAPPRAETPAEPAVLDLRAAGLDDFEPAVALEAPAVGDEPGGARADAAAASAGPAFLNEAIVGAEREAQFGGGRAKRLEQSSVPEPKTQRITTFASEVDPLRFDRLGTGHLVMYRNVWRDDQRFVQGALLDTSRFLEESVASVFGAVALSSASSLRARYRGVDVLRLPARDVAEPPDTDLYEARLSPPLADLELSFSVGALPPGPGYDLLLWVSVVLVIVLIGGFFVMYRFGMRQILLRRQQQDFVSAVSHELKTPLTSIRMYGEMLKAGWASEDKKRSYYAYIYEESERLSRLIENVLALARMNRGEARLKLTTVAVTDLIGLLRAKVATQLERVGFTLTVSVAQDAEAACVGVDRDAFAQIFINLIDNALKFAVHAERKEIAITVRRDLNGVLFVVRDFGPGVPRAKMKRLFELFYRPEDELTRATSGTGIGLGLVKQLATAMHATVDVRNCEPGAEFRLRFPAIQDEAVS